jgi:hypothetical protein
MRAAIEAQALAARSTIEFIQAVGFRRQDTDAQLFPTLPTNNTLNDAAFDAVRSITFTYQQQNTNGANQTVSLTVPILTIVPIPFLRISDMTIDFVAKLTEEVKNSNTDTIQTDIEATTNVGYKAFWSPVTANFHGSVSSKHSSTAQQSNRFSTEATMNVKVHAVQDDLPAGLSKMLSLLEQSITSAQQTVTPAPAPAPAPSGPSQLGPQS